MEEGQIKLLPPSGTQVNGNGGAVFLTIQLEIAFIDEHADLAGKLHEFERFARGELLKFSSLQAVQTFYDRQF